MGDLDRRHADAAGPGMNEDALTLFQVGHSFERVP